MSVGNNSASLSVSRSALEVMEVLEVTRPQALAFKVMEVDENANVVTRKVESSSGFITVRDSFCQGVIRLLEGQGQHIAPP